MLHQVKIFKSSNFLSIFIYYPGI